MMYVTKRQNAIEFCLPDTHAEMLATVVAGTKQGPRAL